MFAGLLFLTVLLLHFGSGSSQPPHPIQQVIPPNTPPVVLVTTLDPASSEAHRQMIVENRKDYAQRHGYATFLPEISDYPLNESNVPTSWSKIPAVRHALTKFPHSSYFFYLDRSAIITNPTLPLHDHITNPARLESLMIPNQPIIPPDSVIRTLNSRDAKKVDFIVTQDNEGLSQNSFILRQGDWAHFFLDSWYDPLYRSYNFQRAEGHALEHLVQWHGTVLARMAIVPQIAMNSYMDGQGDSAWSEGSFVVTSRGCSTLDHPSCEAALKPYYELSKTSRR